jgi:hypothetical protein
LQEDLGCRLSLCVWEAYQYFRPHPVGVEQGKKKRSEIEAPIFSKRVDRRLKISRFDSAFITLYNKIVGYIGPKDALPSPLQSKRTFSPHTTDSDLRLPEKKH